MFNIADDPMETRDLLADAPQQAARCRAVLHDKLNAKTGQPAPDERQQRAQSWPGFHSIGDETCDLLH